MTRGAKLRKHRSLFFLEYRRRHLGWTQGKLNDESGVCRQYISEFERGRRNPSPDELERLARALGVQPPEKLLHVVTVEDDAVEVAAR